MSQDQVKQNYFKVPEARATEQGLWVGGAWFPFKDGIVAVPAAGDYSWALAGFVQVDGPQIPGGPAPQVLTTQDPVDVQHDADAPQ